MHDINRENDPPPCQIPGMDHIDSEYYEVSRVSDPDALSIDSIHKTVFKR